MTEIIIRRGEPRDAASVAALFAAAFGDSISHVFPDGVPLHVLEDLMLFILKHDPWACHVAVECRSDGDLVLGYCLSPASMPRLWVRAFISGDILRIIWRVLTRQFPVNWRQLRTLSRNKVSFLDSFRVVRFSGRAQILSVAVSPEAQGHGVGTRLVKNALASLRRQKVSAVKLEVRPDNEPALKLYENLGFRRWGTTEDSQGTWLVMMKELENLKKRG